MSTHAHAHTHAHTAMDKAVWSFWRPTVLLLHLSAVVTSSEFRTVAVPIPTLVLHQVTCRTQSYPEVLKCLFFYRQSGNVL